MSNVYKFRQWSLTILRIALGIIFIYHGYLKLFVPGGFNGTVGFFTAIGMPLPLYSALLVSIVEFGGGLFLIAGFLAKWASLLLMINMLVAVFKVHIRNGFLVANGGFEFAAALFFCLLAVLLNGPGKFSADRLVFDYDDENGEEKKSGKSSRKAKVKDTEASGVIAQTGISKESGYLYFLDKNGDVARVEMARKGHKTSKRHEVLAKLGVRRKQGYLYYIDSNGNVAQAKMARG